MTTTKTTKNTNKAMEHAVETHWVKDVGAPAASAIVDMVAALRCDYDHLEELRDAREGYAGEDDETEYADDAKRNSAWAGANPDDAEALAELEAAAGECASEDDARERIQEDPLSIQVRSGWHDIGADADDEEFEILLTTGGPAVRIVGDLDNGQPSRPRLQVQDWDKSWTEYFDIDGDALEAYCSVFCFEH